MTCQSVKRPLTMSSAKPAAATLKSNSRKKDGDAILFYVDPTYISDISTSPSIMLLTFLIRFIINSSLLFTTHAAHRTVHVHTPVLDESCVTIVTIFSEPVGLTSEPAIDKRSQQRQHLVK